MKKKKRYKNKNNYVIRYQTKKDFNRAILVLLIQYDAPVKININNKHKINNKNKKYKLRYNSIKRAIYILINSYSIYGYINTIPYNI